MDWLFKQMEQVRNKEICSVILKQVEIQKLRLYCDPHQSERETACEIYSVVRTVSTLISTSILRCVWGHINNNHYFFPTVSCGVQDDERVSECSFYPVPHVLIRVFSKVFIHWGKANLILYLMRCNFVVENFLDKNILLNSEP